MIRAKTWIQALEEQKQKNTKKKHDNIPVTDKDVKIIDKMEYGEYKINSYTCKRLFLLLSDGDMIFQIFGIDRNKIESIDVNKQQLTKNMFCKNVLRVLVLPKSEHLYAIAGWIELYDDVMQPYKTEDRMTLK